MTFDRDGNEITLKMSIWDYKVLNWILNGIYDPDFGLTKKMEDRIRILLRDFSAAEDKHDEILKENIKVRMQAEMDSAVQIGVKSGKIKRSK